MLSLVLRGMTDYTHAGDDNNDPLEIGSVWEGESLRSFGISDTGSILGGSRGITREQQLTDLKDMRKYFDEGFLEITSYNLKSIEQFTMMYESSFDIYDKGIYIKNWKTAISTNDLLELLFKFTCITKLRDKLIMFISNDDVIKQQKYDTLAWVKKDIMNSLIK